MRKFKDISLEAKLKLITMLATGAALLIACVGIVTYEFFSYREALVREVTALSELAGSHSALALNLQFRKEAVENLSALASYPNIVAACVYDKNGREFARYVRKGRGEVFRSPAVQKPGHAFKRGRLELFAPILLEGDAIGTLYIESDLVELEARLRAYATSVLLLMTVALAVAFVLSTRLQKVVSVPLLRLAQAARVVSREKNYGVRVPRSGADELGTLVDGFNEMLAQIEQRDEALRQGRDQLEKRVEERTSQLQSEVQERKQAERVIQQQLNRISLLNRITHAVSERQDVNSILSVVLHHLEQHLMVEFGAFYVYDAANGSLELAAFRAAMPVCPFEAKIATEGIAAAFKPALQGNTVYLPEGGTSALLRSGFDGSAVVVPLTVDSKLFGWLVTGRRAGNGFSSGECEFLKMLSEQVALAAHQAQLYMQLQNAYDELRQTQQAVMQHERLRALGQLASGIAHDINNALSPVMGYAELLVNTEPKLTVAGARYLQHIRTCSEDIAHIVSRLKEFYRQREDTRDFRPIDMNRLAEEVVELTRPRWRDMSQERGIRVDVQLDLLPMLPSVSGIESEVREALTNLIFNAVDALPKGGTITLRTRASGWMPQGDDRLPAEITIEVADTGVGMDKETQKRCLEPFFSTKGLRGTGMGLAMVYGIMERHEGRIEVNSALGHGTTIRLVFPVGIRNGAHDSALAGTPGPSHSRRVLFVDDEPLLRELVSDMLRTEGHQVTVADGGQLGLAVFREALASGQPFDAVITDLGMPDLDGRRLAALLKEESPRTPVIMLTGWGALMRQSGDMPLQVDCVLSKPPRLNDLREALRNTMPATIAAGAR